MEEKSLRTIIIVLLLVIALFAGFVIVKKYKESEFKFSYKGVNGEYLIEKVKFENATDYYINVYANNKAYRIPFRNSPKDLESLYLEDDIKESVINKHWIYITQDPETAKETNQGSFIGLMEFGRLLGTTRDGIYGINTKSALTKPEGNETVTIKTCNDIDLTTGIIYLKLGDENKVYLDNACVIIQGKDEKGLIMSSEKFAYHLLGVF